MCISQECKHNLNKKNMKKVLFLLLVTSISYGQALFDKGVKITGGQTTTTATNKIISQEANGVLNQINATSLPISTATANALDLRTENSSGAIQGFAITNNGNGTVNIATGTAYLRQTNDPYSPIIKYVIPAVTNLALTDNANNFILVDYNAGSPSLTVTTSPGTINTTTNSIAYLISRVGTTLDYINLVGQNVDANGKLRRRFLNTESLRRAQGAVLTSFNRNLLVTAGLFYSGLIEVSTPLFNTSTVDTFTQVYINGTWTRSTGNTQVNNTQYSLGGILTTMPSNDYRVDYVYILADNPSKLYVLLGTATYNNIDDARRSPVPVDLPSELQYLGTRIGRVIIQKNATTMETSSEYATIYQAGSAQLHNDLGGLNLGDFQHLTVAEKANLEVITNKQNSLAVDGTGVKYPTVDATNAGLDMKYSGIVTTNTLPKATGVNTLGSSNITDTGSLISLQIPVVFKQGGLTKAGFDLNGDLYANNFGSTASQVITTGNFLFTSLPQFGIIRGITASEAIFIGGNDNALGINVKTATGNSLFKKSIDNNIDAGQFEGTVSAFPATLSNQVVVKSQLDLKQNTLTNPITGTGTVNFISKFTGTSTQGNSMLSDVSGEIALNQTTNISGFKIKGFANPAENINIFINSTNNASISSTKAMIYSSGSTSPIYFRPGTGGIYFNDNSTSALFFGVAGAPSLFNTFTNNGQGVAQFNGNITLSNGTLPNHGVTKSQLDLKADLLSPTFNGTSSFKSIFASSGNTGYTLYVDNVSTGNGIEGRNFSGAGNFIYASPNNGVGVSMNMSPSSSGIAYVANSDVTATGNLFEFKKNLIITSKFNHLGELTSPKITMNGTIDLKSYTVATLPTGVQGASAYVTDALAPTYLGIVVGGGAVVAPVFYNGTNWVSH